MNSASKGRNRNRKALYFFVSLIIALLLTGVIGFAADGLLQSALDAKPDTTAKKKIDVFGSIGSLFKDNIIKWYTPNGIDEKKRPTFDEAYSTERIVVDLMIFFGLFLSLAMMGLGTWMKDNKAAKGVAVFLALILDFALVFGIHTITGTSVRYTSAIALFFPFAQYFIYIAAFLMVWALLNKMKMFGEGGNFWNFLVALLIVIIAFAGINSAWDWVWYGKGKGYEPQPPIKIQDNKDVDKWIAKLNGDLQTAILAFNEGDLNSAKRYLKLFRRDLPKARALNPSTDQTKKLDDLENAADVLEQRIRDAEGTEPEPDQPVYTIRFSPDTEGSYGEANDIKKAYAMVYAILKKDGVALPGKTIIFRSSGGSISKSSTTDERGVATAKMERPVQSESYPAYAYYEENGREIIRSSSLTISKKSGKVEPHEEIVVDDCPAPAPLLKKAVGVPPADSKKACQNFLAKYKLCKDKNAAYKSEKLKNAYDQICKSLAGDLAMIGPEEAPADSPFDPNWSPFGPTNTAVT